MTITIPATLTPALNRLEELAELPADWDSYGAVPPSIVAVRASRGVLEKLAARYVAIGRPAEPKVVGARADGGVMMEWRGPGGALEVHAEPDGTLGYLWDGDGTMQSGYEEADGVSLAEIDRQLARVLTPPSGS
jgi:hypothetical protein